MTEEGDDRQEDLAAKMVSIARENNKAIGRLSRALESRDDRLDAGLSALRAQVVKLEKILLGEYGDNGLTSRVMLLEKTRNKVSWGAVAVIVGLAMSALGLFLTRGV